MPSSQEPELFRETLRPPWWLFAFALIGSLALGIAYGSALGLTIGLAVGVFATVCFGLGLILTSPRISVTQEHVLAGSAVLPRIALGEVHILDAQEMRNAINLLTAPASSFTTVRSWAAPQGVRLDLTDAADPHAVWLLSSRKPEQLADAVQRMRDRMVT